MQPAPIYDIWRLLGGSREAAEAEVRATCRTVYIGENEALTRILGRYKMYVDTRDIGIASHLMMEGYWEMWVTEAMMRLLRRGAVVADVGANLGYFTLLMADLTGAEGRVLAFEPNPELARRLRKSIAINGFAGFTDFYQCGLGREQGWARMDVRSEQPGGGRTIPIDGIADSAAASGGESAGGSESRGFLPAIKSFFLGKAPGSEAVVAPPAVPDDAVRILRFDELPHAREVEFMKIDVEGFEPQVWEGMTGRLENYDLPLTVFMEFTIERLDDPRGFLERILAWGFSLEIITFTEGVRPITADELFSGPHDVDHMLVFRRDARRTEGDVSEAAAGAASGHRDGD